MAEHIIDTGPLVGWINSRDQWHAWSANVLELLAPPLITCEAVIAEAAWQLGRSRLAVDQLYGLVDAGALRVVDLLPEHMLLQRVDQTRLAQSRFADQEHDLAHPFLGLLPAILEQADLVITAGQWR